MIYFSWLLLFYCTFSQFIIFLYLKLLEFILPLSEKFGYKFNKKWSYRKYLPIIYLFTGLGSLFHLEDKLNHLIIVFYVCIIYVIARQLMNYSIVEINSCQNEDVSIGAFWAHQAYEYYYKIVLESLNDRMLIFEDKHDITFSIRKLILVAPKSCDVSGTFDKKDDFIEYLGDLSINEVDQAANVNRKYKNPVYKIHTISEKPLIESNKYVTTNDKYVVAEFPSSLGTLLKIKKMVEKKVWNYHRKCFIKTLKNLVKNSPCIIVNYDDYGSKSLSHVLVSIISEENNTHNIVIE